MSWGRTGTRVSASPVASRIAATTAAVDEMVGGSPTPLAPNGAPGSGSSMMAATVSVGQVERGRDEVVGERRVADPPVVDHDLLHQRQADALGDAALELAEQLERVQDPADVLGGGEVDQADEAELGVDVDHGPVGGEGERHVGVALAVVVERQRSARGGTRRSPRRLVPRASSATTLRRSSPSRDRQPIAGDARGVGPAPPRRPACTAPPDIHVWRDWPTSSRPSRCDVSAGASTTSSTPSTSRAICWARVTKPWPTSAHAQVTVATPSRERARAPSSSRRSPRRTSRFLNPTANPTPRRTSTGSVVRPAPPGSSAPTGRRRPGSGGRASGSSATARMTSATGRRARRSAGR